MLRQLRWALVGAAVLMAAACSGVTGGQLVRPGEPMAAIDVQNAGSGHINVVLISTCDAMGYGLNRLPSNTSIPPGRSYRFPVSAGCYDVGVGSTVASTEGYRRYNVLPGQVLSIPVASR